MNAAPGTEPRALASGRHAAWSRPLADARGSVLSSRYAQNRLFLWEIAMSSTFMSHPVGSSSSRRYDPPVPLGQLRCVKFDHPAIIRHQAVDLALHVGGLRVDRGGESLLRQRFEFLHQFLVAGLQFGKVLEGSIAP